MSASMLFFLPAAATIDDIGECLGEPPYRPPDGGRAEIAFKREGSLFWYPYSVAERQREDPDDSWTWVSHYVDPWNVWLLSYSGIRDAKWVTIRVGERFGGAIDNGAGWMGNTNDFLELVEHHDEEWDWRLQFLDLESIRRS